MFLRNGVLFDIYKPHVIDGMQYPVGWFYDESVRAEFGIEEVFETPRPAFTATQVAEVAEYAVNAQGKLAIVWAVRDKTTTELEVDAVTLADAKLAKNLEINAARATANQTYFTHGGKQVACDALSRSDIDAVASHISLFATFPADFPGAWKAIDNSYIVLASVDAFKAMYSSMTTQGTANFAKSQSLKAQLAAATTEEEVAAITW